MLDFPQSVGNRCSCNQLHAEKIEDVGQACRHNRVIWSFWKRQPHMVCGHVVVNVDKAAVSGRDQARGTRLTESKLTGPTSVRPEIETQLKFVANSCANRIAREAKAGPPLQFVRRSVQT